MKLMNVLIMKKNNLLDEKFLNGLIDEYNKSAKIWGISQSEVINTAKRELDRIKKVMKECGIIFCENKENKMNLDIANNGELFTMLDLSYKVKSSDDYSKLELKHQQFLNDKIEELEFEITKRDLLNDWKKYLEVKYNTKIEKNFADEYLDFLDRINNTKKYFI